MDRKRVLVVDDEPDFADLVTSHLCEAGFDASSVYSGDDALSRIHTDPPDLVVLDVMMPDKDGYEVCSELKNDTEYAGIPILMLTAVASHVPHSRYTHYDGMKMEADDYLPKPASVGQIEKSIRRLLGMRENSDSSE